MADKSYFERFADRVGYDQTDKDRFEPGDPRLRHMERMAEAAKRYTIEVEVVEARHCNAEHEVGDKFVLNADGLFLTKLCPKKMCVYAMAQLVVPVPLINERLSEGLDPNKFHFMRQVACPDVGVECAGYGRIVMQVRVVPREKG